MLSSLTRQRKLVAAISLFAYFLAHFAAEPFHRFAHGFDTQLAHTTNRALTAATGVAIATPEASDPICLFSKVLSSALKWTSSDALDFDFAIVREFETLQPLAPDSAPTLRPWIDAQSARGPPQA